VISLAYRGIPDNTRSSITATGFKPSNVLSSLYEMVLCG
jgi:hypothetical protein